MNIKEIWLRLRQEDPQMMRSFENFIGNISREMKRSKTEFNMLESALQK